MRLSKISVFFIMGVMTGCASVPLNVYYDHEVTAPAIPFNRAKPDYPPSAARNNISGFIVADLVIAENGTVEAINIIESVPSGVFDKNGENAIKKWQYKPARLNGEPVKQYTKVRLDWNI